MMNLQEQVAYYHPEIAAAVLLRAMQAGIYTAHKSPLSIKAQVWQHLGSPGSFARWTLDHMDRYRRIYKKPTPLNVLDYASFDNYLLELVANGKLKKV